MKALKRILIVAAAAVCTVESFASAAIVLNYDPVVTLVGDGKNTLSSAGATTTIQVYANNVPNQSAPLAQLAYSNGTLVNSGSLISEGELANNPGIADAATAGLTYNGPAYVFSGGYAATDGTAAVSNITANANRVVGAMTVTSSSVSNPTIIATQTQSTSYAGSGNIRAAVGDDSATNVWAAGTSALGGTAGYRYFNNNTAVGNGGAPTNTRTVQIRQGQLYGSSDTSSFVGISLIGNGIPQTTGQTVTQLFSTGTSTVASPEAFVLIDDPNVSTPTLGNTSVPFNVAYIADDNAGNGNSQPGIQKWIYNPANVATNNGWSLAYVITDAVAPPGGVATPDGYNGLAAELVPVSRNGLAAGGTEDDIVLFSTNSLASVTGSNSLEAFVDPLEGGNAASTDSTLVVLANAPANDAFRGVALAPIPEPASLAIVAVGGISLLARRRQK